MATLKIIPLKFGQSIVALSDVLMPNGEKRHYMDFGIEGFSRILARIKTEKSFVQKIVPPKHQEAI